MKLVSFYYWFQDWRVRGEEGQRCGKYWWWRLYHEEVERRRQLKVGGCNCGLMERQVCFTPGCIIRLWSWWWVSGYLQLNLVVHVWQVEHASQIPWFAAYIVYPVTQTLVATNQYHRTLNQYCQQKTANIYSSARLPVSVYGLYCNNIIIIMLQIKLVSIFSNCKLFCI